MSLGVLVFLQIFQRDFSYEKTAVYTATFVAGGWAGAVMSWAGAVMIKIVI